MNLKPGVLRTVATGLVQEVQGKFTMGSDPHKGLTLTRAPGSGLLAAGCMV